MGVDTTTGIRRITQLIKIKAKFIIFIEQLYTFHATHSVPVVRVHMLYNIVLVRDFKYTRELVRHI